MSEGTERDEGHKERRAQTAFDGANGANRWEEVVEQWLQTNMVYTGYVMEKNTSFSFFFDTIAAISPIAKGPKNPKI